MIISDLAYFCSIIESKLQGKLVQYSEDIWTAKYVVNNVYLVCVDWTNFRITFSHRVTNKLKLTCDLEGVAPDACRMMLVRSFNEIHRQLI